MGRSHGTTLECVTDEMVRQHMGLVYSVTNNCSVPQGMERDDLVGVGMTALALALARFDPDRGYRFSTYALSVIRGMVTNYARRMGGSLAARVWRADGEDWPASAMGVVDVEDVADPADPFAEVEARWELEWLLERLPPRPAAILRLRLLGLSYTEVGARMGVSRQRVMQIVSACRDLLGDRASELQ